MSRCAASTYSPSAIARCAAIMKRSTRSSEGSGFEKSTNFMLPAGTVRTPWLNLTRAHCCTSAASSPVSDEK